MTQTPSLVSVDLDRASVTLFLRAYLSAKRILPNIPIKTFVSASGVGFHIKIYKQVTVIEDLKLRALLWDEPYRLYYALKKWALNPAERYIDLVFDEKNDGVETPIDLEHILEPYKKEVEKINQLANEGKTDDAEAVLRDVAKKIEPALSPYKKPQFVGCIAFKSEQLHDELEEICMKIMEKDPTFSWKLYPCWFPEFEWILAVFADSKERAWKRITWLKNRAKKDDKLILKDADTRLFVKERKAT